MDVRVALVLALGGACGGGAKAVRVEAAPVPADVTAAVQGAVEQWRQGYEVRSLDAVAPLYAQAPELTVVHQGRALAGWPAVKESVGGFLATHAKVKVKVEDVRVVALGDGGALATARLTRQYGDDVTAVEEHGQILLVFRKGEAGWLIVSEHYSYVPSVE